MLGRKASSSRASARDKRHGLHHGKAAQVKLKNGCWLACRPVGQHEGSWRRSVGSLLAICLLACHHLLCHLSTFSLAEETPITDLSSKPCKLRRPSFCIGAAGAAVAAVTSVEQPSQHQHMGVVHDHRPTPGALRWHKGAQIEIKTKGYGCPARLHPAQARKLAGWALHCPAAIAALGFTRRPGIARSFPEKILKTRRIVCGYLEECEASGP